MALFAPESRSQSHRTQLFINNEWVDATSGKTFETVNPVTEEVICSVQEAGKEDVDKAVKAATEAFKTWKKSDGSARRKLLLKLAQLIEENWDKLAALESLDNGKPLHCAKFDISLVIECYQYFAGWADKVGGKAWKLAPALAMGCTIVMKPSEKTPLSALAVCDLLIEAGFPPGVVNLVSGHGPTTGEFIARHPGIAKVAFTGSSAVGHKIVEAAGATNLKKVSLELGGKSPMIICKDADLDQAAMACHIGLFINMGQCCCASSRIYIHEDVHDAFVEKVTHLAKRLRTQGDTTSETDVPLCDLGPQVDKIQFDKVLGFIEAGKKEGAKVALGGCREGGKGYYVKPTVFTDVTDDMKIAREEIFGPVMQLMKFKTLDEAIQRANDTHYGLAAGICSRDTGTALAAARELEAGTVWINCYDNFDLAAPFGGFKQSGWGRDKGEYALENYTEIKCVMMPMDSRS